MRRKLEIQEMESTPYKKRSSTSGKSSAKRRSDHAHCYKRVIVKVYIGYSWFGRCSICGKFQNRNLSRSGCQDFIRPECKGKPGFSSASFLSVAEIKGKYPGISIYRSEYNNGKFEYKEITEE